MRIAFFGGSFDPPHRGHLAIAAAAGDRLDLDDVLMAPAALQPLKLEARVSTYGDRLAMVGLAVAGKPRVTASTLDAPRDDGQPNFTIDVIHSLRTTLKASDQLFFLLGADAFLTLRQWHRPTDLLFACEFIVAARPGFPVDDVPASLPDGVSAATNGAGSASRNVLTWTLETSAGARSRLHLMPDLDYEVAATQIRAALAGADSAQSVLCPAVLRYIEEHGLYRR